MFVQDKREESKSDPFTVNIINSKRTGRGVTTTRGVAINLGNGAGVIQLHRTTDATTNKLNGVPISTYPFTDKFGNTIELTSRKGTWAAIRVKIYMMEAYVEWDGRTRVTVKIKHSSMLFNNTQGICGDFNGDKVAIVNSLLLFVFVCMPCFVFILYIIIVE